MSVRNSLLTILTMGPCYGSQLKAEFERRTGGAWPLNVGQVYTTLSRLERDALVTRHPIDASGRERFEITDAGRRASADWLRSSAPAVSAQRDEFVMKVALAVTIPGVDVDRVLTVQQREAASHPHADAAHSAQARLVSLARGEQFEAQLRWTERIRTEPRPAPWGLDDELPKRGRPAKSQR